MSAGWIGVDLDGTLAEYTTWQGADHIGAPIPAMVDRVKRWLLEGREVRIFTARVAYDPLGADQEDRWSRELRIKAWCKEHVGAELPVTCVKDMAMIELWDDRVVAVERNTGRQLSPSSRGLGDEEQR